MDKSKSRLLSLTRTLTGTFMILFIASAADASGPALTYVPGELLIQPKAGISGAKIREVLQSQNATEAGEINAIKVKRIRVPRHLLKKVRTALAKHPHFSFAEYNYIARPTFVPNDYSYPSQWHLPKISAPAAWDLSTGSPEVPIAIIDSGIDPTHPDLAGKIIPGYNCISENTDTHDVYGHGTSVAGTAAAIVNNVEGVAGVAGDAAIMPLVVVNSSGFASYYDIAQAITYAADSNVQIMNISIGGSGSSSTLQNAVNYAWNKGAVIFASAANDATSAPYYPAACQNVVAVSATTSTDTLASFSNFGTWIDIAAPGCSIFTTANGGSYCSKSGTSFSSPIAAGVAALLLAANPFLTNSQIVGIMTQSTDDLGAPGFDPSFGYGRVNASKAVVAAINAVPDTDTMGPEVTIIAPQQGATVSDTITVQVDALDTVAVASVELYIDGTIIASDNAAPYDFLLNTKNYQDGSHSLYAKATDSSGNQSQSDTITIYVSNSIPDTQGPFVTIKQPANGSTVSNKTKITVSGTDNVGIKKIELFIDGKLKTSTSASTLNYNWNTQKEIAGAHTIATKAYDAAGNMGGHSITVYKVNSRFKIHKETVRSKE
ncbi:MAG TPA: S8 family serine peptidase [Thermodesulfobacteriota bacterium]|nr:S8 family serine peptidase [Thermodesulfobacteriota bacterium]